MPLRKKTTIGGRYFNAARFKKQKTRQFVGFLLRRLRESNPRSALTDDCFQDSCDKPLCQASRLR
jgi:hypothetical protein